MKKIRIVIKKPKVKRRILWEFNPTDRIMKSKKLYSRKNFKIGY